MSQGHFRTSTDGAPVTGESVGVKKEGMTTLSRDTALGFSVSAPCSERRSACLTFSRQRSFALRQLFSARLSQDDE